MLCILDSHDNQEMPSKMDDELVTPSTSLSVKLPEVAPLEDNSLKSSVKDLPQVPVISNTLDVSVTDNSPNVNSVDR